jgi:hypothetical protein
MDFRQWLYFAPLARKVFLFSIASAMLVAAVLINSASAGIILSSATIPPGPPVASGPGLGFVSVPAIITLSPGNDNFPTDSPLDNNIVVPLKRFDFNDYIDIEFTVLSTTSPVASEYQVTEFVDNNTGVDWSGYNMYLGFGTGAGFTLSPPGDGLDFDFPLYDAPPTSPAFGTVTPDASGDSLSFSGGTHGSGAQPYLFRIDVPNLGPIPGTGTFTLRQIPIPVPEPSAVVLACLALAGMTAYRRR